ncbi:MAG: hypothetical protein GY751_09025 [Bacteroidetes bacterium]|nr:hypothetical protein [Bacteroidota bacterium]
MDWIIANWTNVLEIVTSVVGVGALIATLTPNASDNSVIDFILKFINLLGANVGNAKNG